MAALEKEKAELGGKLEKKDITFAVVRDEATKPLALHDKYTEEQGAPQVKLELAKARAVKGEKRFKFKHEYFRRY